MFPLSVHIFAESAYCCYYLGAAICGTSAIAAVAPTVGLGEEDTAIAMSILTFFTMLYMVAVPYICILGGIDYEVCGAWIGGSVDETGKVVASLSILNDTDGYNTGILIKISQNILIAFVCLALAVLYDDMVNIEEERIDRRYQEKLVKDSTVGYGAGWDESDDNGRNGDRKVSKNKNKKRVKAPTGGKCAFLWKKFPKFIIGYLVLAIIITIIKPMDEKYADRCLNNVSSMSKWLFTLGFVGKKYLMLHLLSLTYLYLYPYLLVMYMIVMICIVLLIQCKNANLSVFCINMGFRDLTKSMRILILNYMTVSLISL